LSVSVLLEEFSSWVARRPHVAAAALVGSHARGTATPTSDVDLVILCSAPDELLTGDWPELFGEIESRTFEDYGALRSLRVHYRSGTEVEFGVARPSWANLPLDRGTREVLADGVSILHDPARLLHFATRALLA
jgi:predicted nucleotidyltransferase